MAAMDVTRDVPEDVKKEGRDADEVKEEGVKNEGGLEIECGYNDARPLDGIIAHLTRACHGNVHKQGVVRVTVSAVTFQGGYLWGGAPANVADLGTDSFVRCQLDPNSWICYDFKQRRVAPTSYTIRTDVFRFPKSWVFEVSNDGGDGHWEIVDRHDDNSTLIDPHVPRVTHNFAISACPRGSYRFVRLRLMGPDYNGERLALSSLEVFGTLTEIPRPVALPGEFAFCDLEPLEGIISHLTRECGGNVHQMGVVNVTAGVDMEKRGPYSRLAGPVEEVANLATDTFFVGHVDNWKANDPLTNFWICYDFKGRRVTPTSYSLRAGPYEQPMSWVFEVLNDGSEESWEVIDRRERDRTEIHTLYDSYVTSNFAIINPPSGSFRYVRIRLTGPTALGHTICLSSFEVFGKLTDIPRPVAPQGEFPFYHLEPLDGIIAHLTRECGGNVHDKGVVEVTASSVDPNSPLNDVKNVVDLGTDSYFRSTDEEEPWIYYDFKGWRVTPTSYTIKTDIFECPVECHFEVSNDGSEGSWQPVNREFLGRDWHGIRNVGISKPLPGSFRFVRLRHSKSHVCKVLRLTSFEVFGTLSRQ